MWTTGSQGGGGPGRHDPVVLTVGTPPAGATPPPGLHAGVADPSGAAPDREDPDAALVTPFRHGDVTASIAAGMGISVSAVESLLFRARRRFTDVYAELTAEPFRGRRAWSGRPDGG